MTSTALQPAPLLPSDYVRHLCSGFTTMERPEGWDHPYVKRHPALLDQLENTLTTSTTAGESVRASSPAGRPAGRIDVLAFLERINSESRDMAFDLGLGTFPLRQRLRKLAPEVGITEASVFRAWWVSARILTSFDRPAFTPNVPCPNEACERRGSLRVKVEERRSDCIAMCVECHNIWDGSYFGPLAMWIAWASEHLLSRHECPECAGVQVAMRDRAEARRSRN